LVIPLFDHILSLVAINPHLCLLIREHGKWSHNGHNWRWCVCHGMQFIRLSWSRWYCKCTATQENRKFVQKEDKRFEPLFPIFFFLLYSHITLWHLKPVGLAYGSGLHLLAFSDSGELYTWGYNTYSQLGNGNTNHTLAPSLVGGVLVGKTVIQVNIYSYQISVVPIINPFLKGGMRESPLFGFNEWRRSFRLGPE